MLDVMGISKLVIRFFILFRVNETNRRLYLQFYKKVVKDWIEQWSITTNSSITATFCYNMEILLVANVDRHLKKLIDDSDTSPPRFDVVAEFDMAIKYFAIINPTGKFVATVNSFNEFCVVEVAVDRKVCEHGSIEGWIKPKSKFK